MDISKLNEELIYELHMATPINEMAELDGNIEVHSENDKSADMQELKFAHFHWNGVHFKFSRTLPKNASQLRKMIAFDREQKKIDDFELNKLAKILKKKSERKWYKNFENVYEATINQWEALNNREADYID